LPLDNATVDVVCVSSLLDEAVQPEGVVSEIYRVLKPGGKVLAVTPARYDVDFWRYCCFPWQRWIRAASPTASWEWPRYSMHRLRRLFGRFVEHRIHKRQLRRREVPHVWRWVPLPVLERLMGHVLVLKAFKPLSATIPSHIAA